MALTVEGAITSYLLADTNTSKLVGTRIHPSTDPQTIARPKITYQRINTIRNTEVGAWSNDGPNGMALARFQFDVWSDSLLTAKQIATAIRQRVNGFTGVVEGISIDSVQVTQEREMQASLFTGQEKPVQRVMLEITVMYSE